MVVNGVVGICHGFTLYCKTVFGALLCCCQSVHAGDMHLLNSVSDCCYVVVKCVVGGCQGINMLFVNSVL